MLIMNPAFSTLPFSLQFFSLQFAVGFVVLLLASITDLKTREVPDYLSFLLLAFSLGLSLISSALSWSLLPFLSSLLGFIVFYLIALALFYSGQWGGGDAKLFMGMGALFGIPFHLPLISMVPHTFSDVPFLFLFLFFSIFAGGIIGFSWLFYKLVTQRVALFPAIACAFEQPSVKRFRLLLYTFVFIVLASFFFVSDVFVRISLLLLCFLALVLFYLPVIIRVVEKHCMIREIPLAKLTLGDWIVQEIVVRGKRICGHGELGVTEEQLARLKKCHVKNVLVKYGLPFVPSFFAGLVLSLIFRMLV